MTAPRNIDEEPIRVGVLGIGDHASRTVVPALRSSPATVLQAVATRDPEVRAATAAEHGCAAYADLDAMLADGDVEAVFVCTPIGRHHDDGRTVLEAGRHLWCEKAFTETHDQAAALGALAAGRDRALCVSCPPLYHGQFAVMAGLIADGRVGAVRAITARFGFPHLEPSDQRYAAAGGGALLDAGFYTAIVPQALLGQPLEVIGAALTNDAGYAVDTSGSALLRSPDGVTVNAEWGYGRDYVNELVVWGETGSVTAAPAYSKPAHLDARLILRRQNRDEVVEVPAGNQFEAMVARFAEAVADPDARSRFRAQATDQQALLDAVRAAAERR
ncbi:MAG: Gfo/Idh/MocA family oxidoreductase [Magnetovibrio sp.]|nr:Gfo/Idh/MocA family oxidoreductase [Magnetovibrio sp.]